MRTQLFIAIMLFFQAFDSFASESVDPAVSPESRMVVKLDGFAAQCSIDNRLALMAAKEKGTEAAYEIARNSAVACAADKLPKGKAEYRDAIQKAPASKPVLAKAYAAWLRYMDELSTLFDDDARERAEQAFEAAKSEVQAELDAR